MDDAVAMQAFDQAAFEEIESALTGELASWGLASTALGITLGLGTGGPLRRFGRQTAMWGIVDLAIAGVGRLARSRRGMLTPDEVATQVARLRKLLWANAAADVVYVLGGTVIAVRGAAGKTTFRMGVGDGVAIVIQGGFLLLLDVTYARKLSA